MEGEMEDTDEDVELHDRSSSPHSAVLWEKCIQQSIFVDLSEDESLHLSDLESSFAVCLSQADSAPSEASIHLSGNAELYDSEDSCSESSSISSQSERVVEGETKSSKTRVSAQRPNTIREEPPLTQEYEDQGQNTSDEEQEDLPFDGDLGSPYFNQTVHSNMSPDMRETHHESPDVPGLPSEDVGVVHVHAANELDTINPAVGFPEKDNNRNNCLISSTIPAEGPLLSSSPIEEAQKPDKTQVLFRPFSQEELLCLGRLIEAETLPEVSLLESMDETLLSRTLGRNSTEGSRNSSDVATAYSTTVSPNGDNDTSHSFRRGNKGIVVEKSGSGSLEQKGEGSFSNSYSISNSMHVDGEQENIDGSSPDLSRNEKDGENQRTSLIRTRSFSELKYGQGQVHYPLPDFSKVAPKVKIPKAPSGPTRPAPLSPNTIQRTQSSPGMLQVISRVLEDSVQPLENPYIFSHQQEENAPALVHHLQAEYDKLLTKYAEAENLIDQMRLGNKIEVLTEPLLELDCGDQLDGGTQASHFGSFAVSPSPPPVETTSQRNSIQQNETSSSQLDQSAPSDGESMTSGLKDIISQFVQKVEEFKLCVDTMSVSIAEQQMMLKGLIEAQDQLERQYISQKEAHRVLEMQNYLGLARNTGTFDPDRLVEGDIFRIGMHLEDIKEVIDRNVCEQLSSPQSSSTPTPPSLPSTSPPHPQHEEQSGCFSAVADEMDRKGGEGEAGPLHQGDRSEHRSQRSSHDPLLNNTGQGGSLPRSLRGSLEVLDITTTEEEEERSSVSSEGIGNVDILAYLTGANARCREEEWTPSSVSSQHSALSPGSECSLGCSGSLAVEVSCSSDIWKTQSLSEPSFSSSSTSQRIVTPETDSGFGSSYFSQSATGQTQHKLLSDSFQIQNDVESGSESEGSCSNVQTAIYPATSCEQRRGSGQTSIHPAPLTGQQRTPAKTQSCGSSGGGVGVGIGIVATAVSHCLEKTTEEQDSEPNGATRRQQQPPVKNLDPVYSVSMDTTLRDNPPHTCSCNSDAFLALQSEVFRLKKDLEEGLVQLPHLAQKMDYLTYKFRQDRKSKTRSRSHSKPPSNSVSKSSFRSERLSGRDVSSSLAKIEDWISSDMDPSKSNGTDRGNSVIMLQFHSMPAEGRRGSSGLYSCSDSPSGFQSKNLPDRGSEQNNHLKSSDVPYCGQKTGNQRLSHTHSTYRSPPGELENVYSKGRFSPFSPSCLQKPLLQVNYGSSCSLPASYKVREPPLQSHSWKRSTQSDSALLPSNVYFQRTRAPGLVPSRTISRRRGSKEEEMNRTLDRAIEAARSMKRTTDRMAKSLSADLAKAQLYRKHSAF